MKRVKTIRGHRYVFEDNGSGGHNRWHGPSITVRKVGPVNPVTIRQVADSPFIFMVTRKKPRRSR